MEVSFGIRLVLVRVPRAPKCISVFDMRLCNLFRLEFQSFEDTPLYQKWEYVSYVDECTQ